MSGLSLAHITSGDITVGCIIALLVMITKSRHPAVPILLACLIGGVYCLVNHGYLQAGLIGIGALCVLGNEAGTRL